MENTKSTITVNLYGNKHKANIPSSDPDLIEIVGAFVMLLRSHDFDLEDINETFVHHLIETISLSDSYDLVDVFRDFSKYHSEDDTFEVPPGFEAFIKGRENGKK